MSPQQEIFTAIKMLIIELGYDTYEYLPDDSVGYPFVHLGEQFEQRVPTNKSKLFGDTQITIHVWHSDWKKRGSTTKIISHIESELWKLTSTARFKLRVTGTNKQVLTDTTTNSTLLHGVLEVDINYQ